jgi:hypothetical protein
MNGILQKKKRNKSQRGRLSLQCDGSFTNQIVYHSLPL